MNLHLVDGTYELFRAYFGAPNTRSATGIEVGASRGLLRSLLNLLREPDCTHVGVAFDHVIRSYRNDLFDGYKDGEGVEPEILEQFPIAERVAAALGVVVWPMVEFEADDAIASAVTRFVDDERIDQIFICSPDKDLAQCVRGERVVLHDRMRDRVIDEQGVLLENNLETLPHFDFPLILGIESDYETDVLQRNKQRVGLYQELIRSLDKGGAGLSRDVSEVHLQDLGNVSVILNGDTVLVHLGREKFQEKFRRYLATSRELKRKYPHLDSVDLRYQNQVVIRTLDRKSVRKVSRRDLVGG